jgi:hypothetical protein
MNANGTTPATAGASSGRRRGCRPFFLISIVSFVVGPAVGAACSRKSGTQEENQRAQTQQAQQPVDPALARAVGAALQPCIRAHKTPTSSVYTAQLRLERQATGTAVATFAGERTAGHAEFESCAVKAINAAAIPLPQTTTLPVAFDFGPDK